MMIVKFCLIAFVASSYIYEINAEYNLLRPINIRLYHSDGSFKEVAPSNAAELVKSMKKDACTHFYTHGYTASLDQSQSTAILKAMAGNTPCNIIGIDYQPIAYQLYPASVFMANDVAKQTASGIKKMAEAGIDTSKIILSGLSLGAQIAGHIARELPFPVAQVQVFDPAGPMFGPDTSVQKSDALCVQCIHSNAGLLGTTISCGHIDFYPNGGSKQNGCKVDSPGCSHVRSEQYMIEALQKPGSFFGVKCDSYNDFKAGKCDRSLIIPMGPDTPCNVTGKFFLQTNAKSPYGRGMAGTVYDPSINKSK